MKITIMTFGSRGDLQPFLALAVALRERGHDINLAAAAPIDFAAFIKSYDLPYIHIPMNNLDFMGTDVGKRIQREGLSPKILLDFWREVVPDLKAQLVETARLVAEASRDADLLISHGFLIPFAYSIHQQLNIPIILSIAAPIVPTKSFSIILPSVPFGQSVLNPLSYHLLLRGMFLLMIEPMNTYRKSIGLPKLSSGDVIKILFRGDFPLLMHYSRHLVPTPSDWPNTVHVVGNWTLPAPQNWTPPETLSKFIEAGEAPVYMGFGSMPVKNPPKMAETIREALRLANLRGVLLSGWAGLVQEDEHLITIGDTPHDWLFPRMKAIVHHGGAGTTHSALRAGKPALIVPFSADQPFWGRRLAELGVNVPPIAPNKLNTTNLADALSTLTQDSAMQQRAAELGELLRAEDGLAAACDFIENYRQSSPS